MHLELVELLRCPLPHAPSVLVAAADRIVARYITDGLLGCPECGTEYAIRAGVTYFDPTAPERSDLQSHDIQSGDEHAGLRIAAQLAMTEGRTVYVLVGFSAGTVAAIRQLVPAQLMLVNPASRVLAGEEARSHRETAPLGIVIAGDVLPLVVAKFDGMAFAGVPDESMLLAATQLLRSGGRLVASVQCAMPPGVREVVRDDRVWVAEREAVASAPVELSRRR